MREELNVKVGDNKDLISRSALIEELESFSMRITGHANAMALMIADECKKSIINMVEEQPTAYDVDKVVQQLEEERECSYADFTEYVNNYSLCLDDEYEDFFHKGLERAIRVVRAGGVNE